MKTQQNTRLSATNRLRARRRPTDPPATTTNSEEIPSQQSNSQHPKQKRLKIFNTLNHNPQKQKQYQLYQQYKQSNPNGIRFTMQTFPHSIDLNLQMGIPLGFTFSPLVVLENQHAVVMEKNIQQIPRCGGCRAYMNCYNRVEKGNKFTCFLCNSVNYIGEYKEDNLPNNERNSSIYQAKGSPNFYQNIRGEDCIVFLIDISPQAAQSRMIEFAVAVMKSVLLQPQFDQTTILFYTYDEMIYEYDFSGLETRCTIIDKTIEMPLSKGPIFMPLLKDYRTKLLNFLDELHQLSIKNYHKGSNLSKCFQYIYHATCGTGAQYYIFQVNEAFVGEGLFMEQPIKNKDGEFKENIHQIKSLYETRNKMFFDRFAQKFIDNANVINLFIFARQYKNVKVFTDLFKITSSNIKYYSRDSQIELNKFYYEFSYLLSATYFKEVRIQLLISDGWHYTSVYGNSHRMRQHIIFSINQCQASREYLIIVSPNKNIQNIPSNCTVQLVINYRYKKQHNVAVVTAIQTVSGFVDKIYKGINGSYLVGTLAKYFLANLRTEGHTISRQRLVQLIAKVYSGALNYYKPQQEIPYNIMTILMGSLSLLKSNHSNPELIKNSPLFDRLNAERNYLTFCKIETISSYFLPYLFNLSQMEPSMCQGDQDFVYPPTLELKFQNIKEGLFLLDDGLGLYLFIAKYCQEGLLKNVFGKSKFGKNQVLKEEQLMLSNIETGELRQIRNLIKYLRGQKPYSWVPLYLVRCGQNTAIQKNFYLHFILEKYDEYKMYKYSFEEYVEMLRRGENIL